MLFAVEIWRCLNDALAYFPHPLYPQSPRRSLKKVLFYLLPQLPFLLPPPLLPIIISTTAAPRPRFPSHLPPLLGDDVSKLDH